MNINQMVDEINEKICSELGGKYLGDHKTGLGLCFIHAMPQKEGTLFNITGENKLQIHDLIIENYNINKFTIDDKY